MVSPSGVQVRRRDKQRHHHAELEHELTGHPFRYAKVLGLYHADVSYVGHLPGGGRDMVPHRVEFLWVRWYQYLGRQNVHSLDRVDLPSMAAPTSFGFLDPSEVLRAAHIVPHFALGKWRNDGVATSALANDTSPYKAYYINRCVVLFVVLAVLVLDNA
jgi:hypothetical protein